MPKPTPPGSGDSDLPTLPPKQRNRGVKCKGRTVIRWEQDTQVGDLIYRRGDPKLDQDFARQYRPCEGWAANGTDYCAAHGGSTPAAIQAAKRGIALDTPNAQEVLRALMMDERIAPETRLKAAVQVLDRGGVRPGVDVSVDAPGWQKVLGKMFGQSTQDDEPETLETPEPKTPDPSQPPTPRKRAPRKATPPPETPPKHQW